MPLDSSDRTWHARAEYVCSNASKRVWTFSHTKTDIQPRNQRRFLIFETATFPFYERGYPSLILREIASFPFYLFHASRGSENRKTRRHQNRPYSARQDGSLQMQKYEVSSNQFSRACEILNLDFVPFLSQSFPVASTFTLRCLKMPLEPYFSVSLWTSRCRARLSQ